MTARLGSVYLLHFDPPFKHARHYVGFCEQPVIDRVQEHLDGRGSPLVKAAVAAGSHVEIARVWSSVDRQFERRLKKWKNVPRLCPRCNGTLQAGDCVRAERMGTAS